MRINRPTLPAVTAYGVTALFFLIVALFASFDMYGHNVRDHGATVVAYQAIRILAIAYLFWLQYTVGAYALYRLAARAHPFIGVSHVIASFLVGTSIWHVFLLIIGLIGGYEYWAMVLLAGGVMLASVPHMANCVAKCKRPSLARFSIDEKILLALVLVAALAFLFLKGTYPSGGRDFYNHYFPYYLQVITDSNLGPNQVWQHYFYSKGMGMFFMAMLLFDPLAIHLVGSSFIIAGALIVFEFLKRPGKPYLLPLWGMFLYLALYIYTAGPAEFAALGGWGDLEKTHELGAVFILGSLWLMKQAFEARSKYYAAALLATSIGAVVAGFANGILLGAFFAITLAWYVIRRDWWGVKLTFYVGLSAAGALLFILIVNIVNTGIPHDQLIEWFWPIVRWRMVMANGATLELYSLLHDIKAYSEPMKFFDILPNMLIDYFRLYMLWPLGVIAIVLVVAGKHANMPKSLPIVALFLAASLLFATFGGGRTQYLSFFRFSSFNYAPTLIYLLLFWSFASDKTQRVALRIALIVCCIYVMLMPQPMRADIGKQIHAAYLFNTGNYSVRDAIYDQGGRPGRTPTGGIHPAMEEAYQRLPAGTRIWSTSYTAFCMLPECHVEEYFSQITSPRWYDIAMGSVEDGKKILKEEGLNYIFYSRSILTDPAVDAKDQLAGFYNGLSVENIAQTYGIYWTDGWDYILTWKEDSKAPLDKNFMDSWRAYQKQFVEPRSKFFPLKELAPIVKQAIEERAKRPPAPVWLDRN